MLKEGTKKLLEEQPTDWLSTYKNALQRRVDEQSMMMPPPYSFEQTKEMLNTVEGILDARTNPKQKLF